MVILSQMASLCQVLMNDFIATFYKKSDYMIYFPHENNYKKNINHPFNQPLPCICTDKLRNKVRRVYHRTNARCYYSDSKRNRLYFRRNDSTGTGTTGN